MSNFRSVRAYNDNRGFAAPKLPFVNRHNRPGAVGRGYISISRLGTATNPLQRPVSGDELEPRVGLAGQHLAFEYQSESCRLDPLGCPIF